MFFTIWRVFFFVENSKSYKNDFSWVFTERVTYIYSLPLQSIRVKSWWLILQYRFHQHPMNHHSRDRIALAWADHQTYPTLFNSTQNIIYIPIYFKFHMQFSVNYWIHLFINTKLQWGNVIPCWFCTFSYWQRNDQSIIVMVGLFEQWKTE